MDTLTIWHVIIVISGTVSICNFLILMIICSMISRANRETLRLNGETIKLGQETVDILRGVKK